MWRLISFLKLHGKSAWAIALPLRDVRWRSQYTCPSWWTYKELLLRWELVGLYGALHN